jgi:chromosomal replication initiation ATPase DnaA
MTTAVTIDDVLQAVQNVTRIGVRDLKGSGQFRHLSDARVLVYFVATQCFGLPLKVVAYACDRDCTTVGDMVRKAVAVTRFDPELVDRVEEAALGMAQARLSGRHSNPIYATAGI